jgi:hypothetical protein
VWKRLCKDLLQHPLPGAVALSSLGFTVAEVLPLVLDHGRGEAGQTRAWRLEAFRVLHVAWPVRQDHEPYPHGLPILLHFVILVCTWTNVYLIVAIIVCFMCFLSYDMSQHCIKNLQASCSGMLIVPFTQARQRHHSQLPKNCYKGASIL